MTLAIFDLDNTLLAGDSDHLWGQYLVDNQLVDGETYQRENERFYTDYREGKLDILEFLAFALKPLSEHSLEELYSWRYDYIEKQIRPIINQAAYDLVDRHRNAGDALLIITATNRFVTEPIAKLFGIDNLLATDPEQNESGYTGKVSGTPCYRQGKVERLEAWLKETGSDLAGSWFYSDSHNDLPLLGKVDNPVAVDPDETLRKTAEDKGWPIISLRN